MRLVIQRVRSATVTAESPAETQVGGGANPAKTTAVGGASREVARIGQGVVILVGFSAQEQPQLEVLERLSRRLVDLRIFDDGQGRMNRSLRDVDGELLLIPQITLTASLAKGTRPSFHTAAGAEAARGLFEAFVTSLKSQYAKVVTGVFQAKMIVTLENDGPVTFVLES